MAVSLVHAFVSSKANSTDASLVRPVNWNAQHTLTGTANSVLGFDGSGNALDGNLFWAAGILAGGTAAGSTLTLESTTGAGSGDAIFFKTASQVEAMRIDTNQNVVIGGAAAVADAVNSPTPSPFQVHATGSRAAMLLGRWDVGTSDPKFCFLKSRGGTIGTHGQVGSTDLLGETVWEADDGTNFINVSNFRSTVDGAVSTGIVPSRLTMATTTSAGALTEALRIDSSQRVIIGGTAAQIPLNALLEIDSTANSSIDVIGWGNNPHLRIYRTGNQSGSAIGTQFASAGTQGLGQINFLASDGTSFNPAVNCSTSYDTGIQVTANGSFTTASTTITLSLSNNGLVVPGSLVIDLTLASPTLVGTVSTCNGTSLVLTAASLTNSSGSSDLLAIVPAGSMFSNMSIATANVNNLSAAAGASFTTASTTITMASAPPSWVNTSGVFVYDTTAASAVGKVSSVSGTTVTLQAASLINSSGSGDTLVFEAPTSSLNEEMRIDSNGFVTFGGTATVFNNGLEFHRVLNSGRAGNPNIASLGWNLTPHFELYRSAASTINGRGAVAAGNALGSMQWNADDGTNFVTHAQIFSTAEGTISTGIVPSRVAIATGNTTGGNTERVRFDSAGNAQFSGTIGYSSVAFAGVGGAVTQATSRTTGVTLNTICGAITLVSAAGSASFNTFTVTNSTIAATDVVICNQKSGTDKYEIFITNIAAGSFAITFATTGGTTTEQPVFNFAIIKAVAS